MQPFTNRKAILSWWSDRCRPDLALLLQLANSCYKGWVVDVPVHREGTGWRGKPLPEHEALKWQVGDLGLDSIINGKPSEGFKHGNELTGSVFHKDSTGCSGEGTIHLGKPNYTHPVTTYWVQLAGILTHHLLFQVRNSWMRASKTIIFYIFLPERGALGLGEHS